MSGTAGPAPSSAPAYLDRIVPAVLRRLEERRKDLPLPELEAMPSPGREAAPGAAKGRLAAATAVGFAEAIAAKGISLIAEVKRASPSKGPIRPDLEVAPLVEAYERAGARAISVLTEEDYFRGSLADLRAAVASTSLPVLRKDFILDPYQIHEARVAGASAVLLIAALLPGGELQALAGVARRLGLDVLLEVHDESELMRALAVPDVVVGVNNRDLRTFEVSLQTTLNLARLVPANRLLVGESGIRTNHDVRVLQAGGVDGVLVGETLLRSSDIEATIRQLIDDGSVGAQTSNNKRTGEDR